MNTLIHAIINLLIGLAFYLEGYGLLAFVLGAIIIDFDHPFYVVFAKKIYSPRKMWAWHKRENAVKSPHPFFLHLIEIPTILGIIAYFFNWYLFLFFAGMIVHWIFDMSVHRAFHGDFSSLKYYSLIGYVFFARR
jgi:hypothetical protein